VNSFRCVCFFRLRMASSRATATIDRDTLCPIVPFVSPLAPSYRWRPDPFAAPLISAACDVAELAGYYCATKTAPSLPRRRFGHNIKLGRGSPSATGLNVAGIPIHVVGAVTTKWKLAPRESTE
jgi:hypothetical protein